MATNVYGASLAGGTFDFVSFVKQPQTIVRVLSWLCAIVVFATITGEGYVNPSVSGETTCMFNKNDSACTFGVGTGIIAFLACVVFTVLDAYFPHISSARDRKNIVIGDLVVSGAWTFMWFICFCFLANQWSHTGTDVIASAARAVVAFSFFSVITWALLTLFAFKRFRQGVGDIDLGYTDPANDHTTPYPPTHPYTSGPPEGYQQSPFTPNSGYSGEGGYQPPAY
ncbi:synaptogyrin-2a [Chanos chanos]|uniref:Synaptogyrin n=1 Tax=Chanos chanos TaxID=29144 RepID=A0A6J2WNP6_CHACN|nr:synaptogyrin-2-like [Chanos chanos]